MTSAEPVNCHEKYAAAESAKRIDPGWAAVVDSVTTPPADDVIFDVKSTASPATGIPDGLQLFAVFHVDAVVGNQVLVAIYSFLIFFLKFFGWWHPSAGARGGGRD